MNVGQHAFEINVLNYARCPINTSESKSLFSLCVDFRRFHNETVGLPILSPYLAKIPTRIF